jgi:cold shock CspA family protein
MSSNEFDGYPTSNAVVKTVREGYLFATTTAASGGTLDVFVHATDLVDGNFSEVRQGDSLALEVISTPKGWRGRNVRHTEPAGQLS